MSGAAQAQGLRLTPNFSTVFTYSDLQRGGLSSHDFITQLRPGIALSLPGGRVRGSLNYSLDAIHHSRADLPFSYQNALAGQLTAEVVDGFAFVDANATISQSALSAFGTQTLADSQIDNSNRAEVGTLTVTPYVRGRLGLEATYELRLNAAVTNTRRSIAGDSTSTGGSATVNSASGGAIFGWGLTASRQRSSFRLGNSAVNDRFSASVTARPDVDWQLALRGGRESSDGLGGDRRSTNNVGGTVTWTPNTRLSATFDTDRRFFGQSRRVSVQYRLSRSAFTFSSTRDTIGNGNPNGVGQPVTIYQLYDAILLSTFPDPVLRDQAVRAQLALEGRDPNTIVGGGFVNSALSLQTRSDLGWSYSGLRVTLGLQAFSSRSSVIDTRSTLLGSGANQHGYNANLGYRLTPSSSLSLTGSRLVTPGRDGNPGNDLKSLSLSFNEQFSRRISGALSARYTVFNGISNAYREAALTASLGLGF